MIAYLPFTVSTGGAQPRASLIEPDHVIDMYLIQMEFCGDINVVLRWDMIRPPLSSSDLNPAVDFHVMSALLRRNRL